MTAIWQPAARFDGVIDVSHFQLTIDWPRVKAAGIELVFIKATQGADGHDPMFSDNFAGATSNSILSVAYHFLTEDDVSAQCDNLLRVAGHSAPVMVDWEVDPKTGRRPPLAMMEAFCGQVRVRLNRDPLAYHGMYDLSSPTINAFPWMVPKFGPEPRGPHWLFWQYSPHGRVDGIKTEVDRSVFAGTLDELRLWWRDGTLPAVFAPAPAVPAGSVPQAPAYAAEPIDLIMKAQIMLGVEADGDPGPVTRAAARAWREAHPS